MKRILTILFVTLFLCNLSAQVQTTARVTYYNLVGKTASGVKTHRGVCAVSRDLERMGFKIGEKVYVEGYGTFQILDRTAARLKKTVDIWLPKGKPTLNGKKFVNGKGVKIRLIYDND